jgi:L-fuconolactonase
MEPGVEIVDAHHHLSDPEGSSYLLDDLLADTSSGHWVTLTVYGECGWRWNQAQPALVSLPETAFKLIASDMSGAKRRRCFSRLPATFTP